jgi:hypothetical protein
MIWRFLVSLVVLAATSHGGDVERIPDFFMEQNYKIVSFDDLMKAPQQYSGTSICISGFLGRDFDWMDSSDIPALYNKAFSAPEGPGKDLFKIGIDPIYAFALGKFHFSNGIKIFGVCRVENNKIYLDRIDRARAADGTEFLALFRVIQK